jgi:hypothetical protein
MRFTLSAVALLLASPSAMADCKHPAAIGLEPGAHDSTVEADAPSTTIDCYQFAAKVGQQVVIEISGGKGDAVFAVYGPGWEASCDTADDCDISGDLLGDEQTTEWSDTASVTGAYLIVVDNSRSDSDYRLNVEFR